MKLGVCYYPEHWPSERWPVDAALMRQAGITLVRIADFAWSAMEPKEGEFTWEWLDQAIETLAAEGLQILICTPTASPPPWMSRAYPDILLVDSQGRRRRPGSRRHYCINSSTYHQHTVRIVSALGARYGKHPAVAGWQIDNEFGCHDSARCYCDNCAAAFRRWLAAKYQTIDQLNQAWGTIFWSQVYNDWEEVDPPNLTVAEPNPSHVLDYDRFSSDAFLTYQQLQISTLQPHLASQQVVTTNFMGQFTDINYYDLARPLDFVTMSSYPTGHAEAAPAFYLPASPRPALAYDVGDPYITSLGHTLMRGYKPGRPFWIMEQQCGNINWSKYNTGVRLGTVRLWTWHALASGADTVVYFRWRAGLYAQEQMHSGLLHHDASPAVGYKDLLAMKDELGLMAEITTMQHEAQIAFLLDFDSLWAQRLQPHHSDMEYMRLLFVYYRALQRLGLPADIVSVDADLSAYKLLILPTALVVTDQMASRLQEYARGGGTILVGVRSGFKDQYNRVVDMPLPGLLRELVGITISDWHSLPKGISYDFSSSIRGLTGPAKMWAEALEEAGAEPVQEMPGIQVLAKYTSGPFSGNAALVEHPTGSGRALYLGWHPDDEQAESLMAYLASQAGVHPIARIPEGLVAFSRGPYLILLNFTDEPRMATVQERAHTIGPRDVLIVRTST